MQDHAKHRALLALALAALYIPVTGAGCPADLDGDGWTEAQGDCDDTDAAVFPGAPEQCADDPEADGVDNDCNGEVDDDCPAPGLEPGFEQALTRTGGCADAILYATNEDDSMALVFMTSGVIDPEGSPTTAVYDLPNPVVQLEVRVGQNVTHMVCNDALYLEVRIDAVYEAVSGRAVLEVDPIGDPEPWGEQLSDARLTLEDVVLVNETEAGGEGTLPWFELEAVIGWLPG